MGQLEESVGYIVRGQCLRNATLQQLLVCPPGQESLPADELANHCQVLGIKCPQVHASACCVWIFLYCNHYAVLGIHAYLPWWCVSLAHLV